jgi:hypothetical protein
VCDPSLVRESKARGAGVSQPEGLPPTTICAWPNVRRA